MQIKFSPPYIDDEVISEVVQTLKSGWITTGPKVRELELEIKKFTGCQEAVAVNSWTSGAIMILKWFGVGPGDEVIVPAYTYSATALAVLQCGAKPVMVDILDDFTLDYKKLEGVISEKTKAIMPVDFAGLMCDYDKINQVINDSKVKAKFISTNEIQRTLGRILLISDAAHSIGAFYKNKPAGIWADITIFSLHAVKNITTAEGGMICLNLPSMFDPEETYKYLRMMSLNGQTKDALSKSIAGSWKYDIAFLGLKINMPDICAAIGLAQIKKYSVLLKERLRVAEYYENYFQKFDYYKLPIIRDEFRDSSNHIYPLRIKNISESQRDEIINIVSHHGISVNVHFIPMPMLTLFKSLSYDIKDFPVAYANYACEISLPIYPQLTIDELKYICESVNNAYWQIQTSSC